jgi:hypothetical protein
MHTPQKSAHWRNTPDQLAISNNPSILKPTASNAKRHRLVARGDKSQPEGFQASSQSKAKRVEFRPELSRVDVGSRAPLSNVKVDGNAMGSLETRLQVYFKKKKAAHASSDLRISRCSNQRIGSVYLKLNVNSYVQRPSARGEVSKGLPSNRMSRLSMENTPCKNTTDRNSARVIEVPRTEDDRLTKEFKASEYGLSTLEPETNPTTNHLCSQLYCGEELTDNQLSKSPEHAFKLFSNSMPPGSIIESTMYKHLYEKLACEYDELKYRCEKNELELSKIKRVVLPQQLSDSNIGPNLDDSELDKIAKFETAKLNDQRLLSEIHQSTSFIPSRPQSLQSSHYTQPLPSAITNSDRISRLDIENILSARVIRPTASNQTERSQRAEKSHFEKFTSRFADIKKNQTMPTNRKLNHGELSLRQKIDPVLISYARPLDFDHSKNDPLIDRVRKMQTLRVPFDRI